MNTFTIPSRTGAFCAGENDSTEVKERETEKRDIPPTPPIERKGLEKEGASSSGAPSARVRAREARERDVPLPPVIDVHTPPSLELLLSFAHRRLKFFDDDFTREWFHIMNEEFMWCYPESGEPIHHWPAYFRLWRIKRKLFDAINDPGRIPDARKGGGSRRKADNWRGTDPKDIENVF